MLQLAASNGIDVLDTAILYGESEACLGELGVKPFKLVSKLPPVPLDCADVSAWVREQVKLSLGRLNISELYGLLLHRSDQLLGENGRSLYRALLGLKDLGLVRKIGVSIYSPSELDDVTRIAHLDLIQAPFNLVDRRLYTSGWMQRLKDAGTEVHTRSAFLQGLLLMPQAAMPVKFVPWNNLWFRWHQWLGCHDVSALQASLAYPLSFREIDRVVVGADNSSQLAQIIQASNNPSMLDLPDLLCEDESLINPSKWPKL